MAHLAPAAMVREQLIQRVMAAHSLDLDTATTAVDDALARGLDSPHADLVAPIARELFREITAPVVKAVNQQAQVMQRQFQQFAAAVNTAMKPVLQALAPVAVKIDRAITDTARDGIRDHERGLRMAAHHPDLAELDQLMDDMYERPEGA